MNLDKDKNIFPKKDYLDLFVDISAKEKNPSLGERLEEMTRVLKKEIAIGWRTGKLSSSCLHIPNITNNVNITNLAASLTSSLI